MPTEKPNRPFTPRETKHSMKRRAPWHNYRHPGVYMLTLVVDGRRPLFGRLELCGSAAENGEGAHVTLSALGEAILNEELQKITKFHPNVLIWQACIMPDHLHLIVRVDDWLKRGLHLGDVMRGFKTGCNNAYWRLGGETTVKAYMEDRNDEPWLVPMNENYVPIKIQEGDDFRVLGRVISIQKPARLGAKVCRKMFDRIAPKKSETLSAGRIKRAIGEVKDMIQSNRQWYAVFRVLIDRGYYGSVGDVYTFVNDMADMFPTADLRLDAEDLRKLAVLSFAKPVALWEADDAPVSGKRFGDYLSIARTFNRAL